MKLRYLLAFVITGVGLTIAASYDLTYVILGWTGWRFPYQYNWVFYITHAIASLLIALSIKFTTPSVQWRQFIVLTTAWYLGLYCALSFMKGYQNTQISRDVVSLLAHLTGQIRIEYLYFTLDLPISMLVTGLTLRNVNTAVGLKHVALLAVGGLAITWGHQFYLGITYPDANSPPSHYLSADTRFALRLTWVLLASAWLNFMLVLAQRSDQSKESAAKTSTYSPVRLIHSPNVLLNYFKGKSLTGTQNLLVVLSAIALSVATAVVANLSWLSQRIVRDVALYLPPVLGTIFGIITFKHYRNQEAQALLRLTNLTPLNIYLSLVKGIVHRYWWIWLSCLGMFLAASIDTLNKFNRISDFQMGVPLILVIAAWAGATLLGILIGVSSTLHVATETILIAAPFLSLLAAWVLLTNALNEIGPKGWVTAVANLIMFTAIIYFGLGEMIRFESAPRS